MTKADLQTDDPETVEKGKKKVKSPTETVIFPGSLVYLIALALANTRITAQSLAQGLFSYLFSSQGGVIEINHTCDFST